MNLLNLSAVGLTLRINLSDSTSVFPPRNFLLQTHENNKDRRRQWVILVIRHITIKIFKPDQITQDVLKYILFPSRQNKISARKLDENKSKFKLDVDSYTRPSQLTPPRVLQWLMIFPSQGPWTAAQRVSQGDDRCVSRSLISKYHQIIR